MLTATAPGFALRAPTGASQTRRSDCDAMGRGEGPVTRLSVQITSYLFAQRPGPGERAGKAAPATSDRRRRGAVYPFISPIDSSFRIT